MFIHRWHAPQTIGEQHGRPGVGMRFEHINHRESLTEYLWRYGAFRENDDGAGRQDVSPAPSPANGLHAMIRELERRAPGLLSHAVNYAIFKYGNADPGADREQARQWAQQMNELASRQPAIVIFAHKLHRLQHDMLPFYVQMRYITTDEAAVYAAGRIPLLAPLRPVDNPGTAPYVGKDPVVLSGDPVSVLREAFSRNIYNALCWRARAELFGIPGAATEGEDGGGYTTQTRENALWSAAIIQNRQKRFRVTDAALIKTLGSLNETGFPRLFRILATFKTAVSTMITAMPIFIVKNFFRDTLAGFVAGRYWQMPFTSTLGGALFAARDVVTGHSEAMRDYLLQGGFYSGLVESEVRVDSAVHGLSGGLQFHRAQRGFRRLVHVLTRPAWVAEAGTRIIQYRRALAAGAARYDAIRAARMVSSDFANIGASRNWRMYIHTVPFFNAALQGLDQLYQICRPEYRNGRNRPRWGRERKKHVKKTLLAGACLAGMSFGVWQWNTGDAARLVQYLGETDYEKASYLTLYDISGKTDLRIPVPFQIGAAFMKLPEIGFDLTTDTATLAGPRFAWSLIHGNLAISWLPAAIQPFWEVKTNTNFFGSPIIPGYMANWPPVRQFFRSTPQPMIQTGWLLGVSPLHVQTFVRGWTGHLGTFIVTGLDELMWDIEQHGQQPFPRTVGLATGIASIKPPTFKSRSRWSEEFYELADWAAGWSRRGWTETDERPEEALRVNRTANRVKRQLRTLNKTIYQVRKQETMSRDQKERRITELYLERTALYKTTVQDMRKDYNRWKSGR